MAWAGTGVLWVVSGGVLKSYGLGKIIENSAKEIATGELSFVQISDSHIGFNKEANPDVVATLQAAIAKINAVPNVPSFMIHTGDLTHLSKPSEFDTVAQILKTAKPDTKFYVPGEHDTMVDEGKQYFRTVRQRHKRVGMVQLRFERRSLHRVDKRIELQGRRDGQSRSRPNKVARRRRAKLIEQHPDSRFCSYASLDNLFRLGMGYGRCRSGAFVPEAIRLGHGSQRTHPPDDAEDRRQYHIPHCNVNGIPPAGSGYRTRSWTDESARVRN